MTINISVFFFWGGGGCGERAKIFLPKSKYFSMRKEDEFAIDIAQTNKTPHTHTG